MIVVADARNRLPLSSEGEDYVVFGSSNANGKIMVIAAAGLLTSV